jgi:nicotinamide riboside kinase
MAAKSGWKQGQLAYEDFLAIAQVQITREAALLTSAQAWLICDTTPLTIYFYGLDTCGRVEPRLAQLAKRPYDYTFVCDIDIPFEQDGTRTSSDYRARQHAWYLKELQQRQVTYQLVSGTVAERLAQVLAIIKP